MIKPTRLPVMQRCIFAARLSFSRWLLQVLAVLLLLPGTGLAAEPFFQGKTLELITAYSDGNRGHTIVREWARTLERLYPGTRVVVRSNSGGTSVLAHALLAKAEPDGLHLGSWEITSVIAYGLGDDPNPPSDFALLGALVRKRDVLFANKMSNLGSLDDLKTSASVMPVRATVSSSYYTSLLLNAYLQSRIKPVTGYSTAEADLAYMTGEGSLILLNAKNAIKALDDGEGIPLLVLARDVPDPKFSKTPNLSTVRGEVAFQWVADAIDAISYDRILAVPSGVPPDRLAALREAFLKVSGDPGFVDVIEKLTLLSPTSGGDLEKAVAAIGADNEDFSSRLKSALDCGRLLAESGGPCGP